LLAIIDWNTWNAMASGPSTTHLHACMHASICVSVQQQVFHGSSSPGELEPQPFFFPWRYISP
jgi:hypothetical protein